MDINKIVIGDPEAPLLVFENDSIESITEDTAVAIIGDELSVDQFTPAVRYHVFLRYVFRPTDYDQFITKDDLVMCGHYNYDFRMLPYGTKITFFRNNKISGVFYCENVERIGKELYQVNAVSAVGLMSRQSSKGGIYTGQTFAAVLREIVGSEYEYVINDDVADVQVYGWLPYSTRRKNLHQLIMAYGVNIIRDDAGNLLFTFLNNITPEGIPEGRIFAYGKVKYNDPASRVEVTEHAYHYLSNVDEETLFDNTSSDAVSDAVITFDKPIYVSSLRVLDGGSLKIKSSGVNYAVVSGIGVLVGKPYTHTTKIVSADNPEAQSEKVVRVEEATLVTLANSENVLARLSQYYFNATIAESDIVVEGEKTGRRYNFMNAFYEYTSGFLTKMSTNASRIMRASCEFIANYVPAAPGSTYKHAVILPEASGTWTVPQEVFEKASPNIRVVLIGGGSAGSAGTAGEAGKKGTDHSGGAGGAGGSGGAGGAGGKVYSETIDCTGIAKFSYGRNGNNTYFSGGGNNLNSINGVSSASGFLEIFSGVVYALPGHAGHAGAKGGKGGYYPPRGNGTYAENGESVAENGRTYYGGTAGSKQIIETTPGVTDAYIAGGGGGGAAYGANGNNGYGHGHGGNGANGSAGDAVVSVYGTGGNGGNGGGGGGGGGVQTYWNYAYVTIVGVVNKEGGAGGAGGAGSNGYQGCVIIYY